MYDEQLREKHSSQTVLVNVRSREHRFLSANTICTYVGYKASSDARGCVPPPIRPVAQDGSLHTVRRHSNRNSSGDNDEGTRGGARESGAPFPSAISKFIRFHGGRYLSASPDNASSCLVTLSWQYARGNPDEARDRIFAYGPAAIGFGADVTVFGADHTSVTSQASPHAPLSPRLATLQASGWDRVLRQSQLPGKMCAPPASCIFRSVLPSGLQSNREAYVAFSTEAHHAVDRYPNWHFMDAFEALWHGRREGLLNLPDANQIHWNDNGREFLAQLLLNALGLILLPPPQGLPPPSPASEIGRRQAAGVGPLRYARAPFPNVWAACRGAAAQMSATGPERVPPRSLPALEQACASCAPCRNGTLEQWMMKRAFAPWSS